jgi:hypothetical protein
MQSPKKFLKRISKLDVGLEPHGQRGEVVGIPLGQRGGDDDCVEAE